LGPVFGSTSENIYGFRLTQDIVAVTLMIFMVLYFVLCGGFSIFAAREVSKSQLASQKVGDQR
jgi:preprotein translocase subunit SecG